MRDLKSILFAAMIFALAGLPAHGQLSAIKGYNVKADGFYGGASKPGDGHFDQSKMLPGCFSSPHLYRGGYPIYENPSALKMLQLKGVKVIIDLRAERPAKDIQKEKVLEEQYGMKVLWVPLTTGSTRDPKVNNPQTTLEGLHFAEYALRNGLPIFVHCRHGEDRTGEFIELLRTGIGTIAACTDAKAEFSRYGGTRYRPLQELVRKVKELNK